MPRRRTFGLVLLTALVVPVGAWPVLAATCASGFLEGPAALQSGWGNDGPGVCRRVRPSDIGPPTLSNVSSSQIVPIPAGTLPKVPHGFRVSRFYRDSEQPRLIRAAPNGDIFVAEGLAGRVRVLRPAGSCQLRTTGLFASGLDRPFGIAFYPTGPHPWYVYLAENSRVVRYPYTAGDLVARSGRQVVVPDLPQGAGQLPGKGHWTRDVVFSADSSTMYVAVGSYSNVQQAGEDETDRATILAFDPEGKNRRVFASGLRNPVSLSVSPVDRTLWASVNERDGLGDNFVPDYVTRVWHGQFFGWPWYYIGSHRDPRPTSLPPPGLPQVTVPKVLLQSHSASLGSAFYTGTQFPAEYRGSLFVAQHGSWNRANPTGSKVVRLIFTPEGQAKSYCEDFMTGFVSSNHKVWGRPVGVAVGGDGSLYVSEDANNAIYCVSYPG
ncbi:MAG: PQQ-dependent sugar dehydrogenase [Geminicoccaceae bacterium]